MFRRIPTKQQRTSLTRIAVLVLLTLYVAGTSQFELIHSLVHKHESQEADTFGQKMNACDLSIYYNDVENGCHHESHFVVSDKCDMCDIAWHGDQTIFINHLFSKGEFSSNYFDFYKLNLDSYRAVISSSRAPPVLA